MARIFVGSSTEGLPVARAIRSNLEHDAEVTVWNEGVFRLSRQSLESIVEALDRTDFGVFVFTPDDRTLMRGEEKSSVRDNVILELGLFIGRLGRLRTFIVQPRDVDFHLPTDLLGITVATYDGQREDLQAALGTACDQIRRELSDHRPVFPDKGTFGPNILSPEIEVLDPTQEYSLTFEVPHGLRVEVELAQEELGEGGWAMRLGPSRRIDYSRGSEGKQRFWNTEPGLAETPIVFRERGAAWVTVYSNGEVILSKRLAW